MKKIVVINTKTGEVQSVEKYVQSTSDIWVAGWIETANPDAMPSKQQVGATLHNIFKRLEQIEGYIKNLNHRLELQEEMGADRVIPRLDQLDKTTYEFSKQIALLNERTVNDIAKLSEAVSITHDELSVLDSAFRSTDHEGTKRYTLHELDKLTHELARLRGSLKEHIEMSQWNGASKQVVGVPPKKENKCGRPKKKQ